MQLLRTRLHSLAPGITCASLGLLLVTSCTKKTEISPDHPRLTPNAVVRDVTFRSFALNRDMQYRAVLPSSVPPERKWPVVYLLHGGGADFHSWTNDSDVAQFAEKGFVLVMPEGNSSYYINAAERPQDKYEDYIVNDLITDAESRFANRRRPQPPCCHRRFYGWIWRD